MVTTNARMQDRRRTAAQFTSENPVLAMAERGYESDTGFWKYGDGVTAYNSLLYANPSLATSDPAKVPVSTSGAATTLDVDDLGWAPLLVRRTSDLTRNNTDTLADDTVLLLAVAANVTYDMYLYLAYTSATTADIKISFSGPASATMSWTSNGFASNVAAGTAGAVTRQHLSISPAAHVIGGAGANNVVALARGLLIVAGTAGTLTFRWAQGTAEVSDTTVLTGSHMILSRIA